MSPPRPCTESDAVLNARIAMLLEQRWRPTDTRALEQRREELRHAFHCLSSAAAEPLLERLRQPDARDPLTVAFMRLATATRQELLQLLERTLGLTPAPAPEVGPGSLPPSAARRLFEQEADTRLAEALALPTRERLLLADRTIRSLRTLASDPRF